MLCEESTLTTGAKASVYAYQHNGDGQLMNNMFQKANQVASFKVVGCSKYYDHMTAADFIMRPQDFYEPLQISKFGVTVPQETFTAACLQSGLSEVLIRTTDVALPKLQVTLEVTLWVYKT
jgi:hypothetical protein